MPKSSSQPFLFGIYPGGPVGAESGQKSDIRRAAPVVTGPAARFATVTAMSLVGAVRALSAHKETRNPLGCMIGANLIRPLWSAP